MKNRERLDKVLVERGLVKSRDRAKAVIMEGKVLVDGSKIMKAGSMVDPGSDIVLKGNEIPYVSRGGLKLEAALDFFGIRSEGKIVMDIGCSTGGFTDCLLQRNAAKVYAVDVGYGQFDWSLRHNPKVILFERTNIRYLEKTAVPDRIDLIVIDVSFISLRKVLPKVLEYLADGGEVLALVKPQFEVGKGLIGKGGIVKEESLRISSVQDVREAAEELGFSHVGSFESPVSGQKGNREYFLYLRGP